MLEDDFIKERQNIRQIMLKFSRAINQGKPLDDDLRDEISSDDILRRRFKKKTPNKFLEELDEEYESKHTKKSNIYFINCNFNKKKNIIMNRTVLRLFIPSGVWYDFFTGRKFNGNKYYISFYRDEEYPVFVKEGSIIPLSLDKTVNNPTNLEIVVFPGVNSTYSLYEDDGVSFGYKSGICSITKFDYEFSSNSYTLKIGNASNSNLVPNTRNYRVRFKNTSFANVVVNGVNFNDYISIEGNDLVVNINNASSTSSYVINVSSDNGLSLSQEKYIYEDIKSILEDLEIETRLKEKIDAVLFSDLPIKNKRIEIRKLRKAKLEAKYIKVFLSLLDILSVQ